MRIVKCDVCGEEYGPKDDMIEMVIPASFLEEEGEGLLIDVCGWPCVYQVVDTAMDRVSSEEEKEEEEAKPEKFVVIPKTPTINVDMDPKALAKFTEQATGVKRRS